MADTQEQPASANKPAPKEKLQSIMEAASALTALGDEESTGSPSPTPISTPQKLSVKSPSSAAASAKEDEESPKRYIPEHKKPDAALTFPEKVRLQLHYSCLHGPSIKAPPLH